MVIGVIGVGIISSYIVEGFCGYGDCEHTFLLSPRGKENSLKLKEKYPALIEVAKDNQSVIDNSDYVILSLLPQTAEEILSELNFNKSSKVISVIPVLGLEKIKMILGDVDLIVDVLPLPFIEKRMGPLAVYPKNQDVISLISHLGDIVAVDNENEMSTLRTITSLMSPYYEVLHHITEWAGEKGVGEINAKNYAVSFFNALGFMANSVKEGELFHLAKEMTPNGLNHQATEYIKAQNGFEIWQNALEGVYKRVTKEHI